MPVDIVFRNITIITSKTASQIFQTTATARKNACLREMLDYDLFIEYELNDSSFEFSSATEFIALCKWNPTITKFRVS